MYAFYNVHAMYTTFHDTTVPTRPQPTCLAAEGQLNLQRSPGRPGYPIHGQRPPSLKSRGGPPSPLPRGSPQRRAVA